MDFTGGIAEVIKMEEAKNTNDEKTKLFFKLKGESSQQVHKIQQSVSKPENKKKNRKKEFPSQQGRARRFLSAPLKGETGKGLIPK